METKKPKREETSVDEDNEIIKQFRVHQKELDTRHDKHERLVKLSRDITIESKRAIFLMQRHSGLDADDEILDQAWQKIKEIQNQKFRNIAKELQNEDPHQFLRAYSAGLQEYIEAISFYHYLKSKTLVTLEQVQSDLCFPVSVTDSNSGTNTSENAVQTNINDLIQVYIPPSEYILGLADLTGELMRLAINSVGSGNLDTPHKVCQYLRHMLSGYSTLGNVSRELGRKISVLRQSLQKVEAACYTLQIRGSEIPKHMLKDVFRSQPIQEQSFADDHDVNDD